MAWRVGEILIQKKLITWAQLEEALKEQKQTKELTGQILIRKGLISEHLFYQALAEQHNLRFVDLSRIRINPKAIDCVARSIAEKFLVLPVDITTDALYVAINDPTFGWPEMELKKVTGFKKVKACLALPDDLKRGIEEHYGNKNFQEAS